jgi:broad specificity phosphatase PhoE
MYGIAQGRTRQWLRELAKENGVPYINYTPPGAELTTEVRERAIIFFRKLCQELLQTFGAKSSINSCTPKSFTKQDTSRSLSQSASSENLSSSGQTLTDMSRRRSYTTGDIQAKLTNNITITASSQSSIDSALDLSSLSSDQQSISSSSSLMSRNSSFEKQRSLFKGLSHSPYENRFSDLDILIVSHGAVIRELIKYFACDLQTDIGEHLDTIQDIAPNTSVTRFEVSYTSNADSVPTTTLALVDYHSKTHLINANNDEFNLDVINKCSF